MSVKTGGYQHKIGIKFPRHRQKPMLKQFTAFPITCSRSHWQIKRVTTAASGTTFLGPTCTGIAGRRVLVQAAKKYRCIVFKGMLCSVAVVHVPIKYQDFIKTMFSLQVSTGDGHVIKQAETHRPIILGVMPRRPQGTKPVDSHVRYDHVTCRESQRHRLAGDFERFRTNRRIRLINVSPAFPARRIQAVDILTTMNLSDPFVRLDPLGYAEQGLPLVPPLELSDNAQQSLGPLWMNARIVLQEQFIITKYTCH